MSTMTTATDFAADCLLYIDADGRARLGDGVAVTEHPSELGVTFELYSPKTGGRSYFDADSVITGPGGPAFVKAGPILRQLASLPRGEWVDTGLRLPGSTS